MYLHLLGACRWLDPRWAWEQRDGAGGIVQLCVFACPRPAHPVLGIVAPVVARARCDGRFRHAGVLERETDEFERKKARARKLILQRITKFRSFFANFLFYFYVHDIYAVLNLHLSLTRTVLGTHCEAVYFIGDARRAFASEVAFVRFEGLSPYGRLCSNRAIWRRALSILETASRIVRDMNAEIRVCSRYISQEDCNSRFLGELWLQFFFSITIGPKSLFFFEKLVGDPRMRFIEYRNC